MSRALPLVLLLPIMGTGVLADGHRPVVTRCAAGDSPCLIAALEAAQSNGRMNVIRLEAGSYPLTLAYGQDPRLQLGLPVVSGQVRVLGAGTDLTIIERGVTSPGPGSQFRIVTVGSSGCLRLEGVTLRGGSVGAGGGGGLNNQGEATLVKVAISANSSGDRGGGVRNSGTFRMIDSRIEGNDTHPTGGGLENSGSAWIEGSVISDNGADGGGGIRNTGQLVIVGSLLTSNIGNQSAALENVGGSVDLRASSVVDNRSGSVRGDVVRNVNGTIAVEGVTVAGNRVGSSGIAAVFDNRGLLTVVNSTIAENLGPSPVPYETTVAFYNAAGEIRVRNTIVARNALGVDCMGGMTSLGHNLIADPTTCDVDLLATDLTGDPGLEALAAGIVPLRADSQAIDAIEADACPALDQRGLPRVDGDADRRVACDIGAIERIDHVILLAVRSHGPLLGHGHRPLTLDVLGSATFDVTAIDVSTARAGATGYELRAAAAHRVDANDDGYPDLRVTFRGAHGRVASPTATISFTAKTCDGETVAGTRVVLSPAPAPGRSHSDGDPTHRQLDRHDD